MKLQVLDLFSGIGGFSLGLESTGGFETSAFCERDEKAREVLKKYWPQVTIFEDVVGLCAETLAKKGIKVDVVTGGFPCQDISNAGRGRGLSGERSGLWFQMYRIIKETQPQWAIIENASALRNRGLDQVLRGLSEIGYDAEWHCIPASELGAPHQRDRIWIVAYSSSVRQSRQRQSEQSQYPAPIITREAVESQYGRVSHIWKTEPGVGRVANGIPGRVDRLTQLGNAIVPQIAELIGNSILQQRKS